MSRSKRAPIYTQGYGGKTRTWSKRQANKAVRRAEKSSIPSGKSYKKEYSSWDIVDWKFYCKTDKKVRRK